MAWLDEKAPGRKHNNATIGYDSHYATDITQEIAEPQRNIELARQCQQMYRRFRTPHNIKWQWVKGHSNHTGNEKPDRLAGAGSQGQMGEHSKRWALIDLLSLLPTPKHAENAGGFVAMLEFVEHTRRHVQHSPMNSHVAHGGNTRNRKAGSAHEAKCACDVDKNKLRETAR